MVATRQVGAVSMNGVVNPVSIKITPEMAELMLSTMPYEHQRAKKPTHVVFLAEEMRRGKFWDGSLIHIISCKGRQIIADGQHRLSAVVMSGISQVFTRLTTEVDTWEEVAWIYGNTDAGLKRFGSDLFGALQLDQRLLLTATEIRTLNGAINYMATGCLSNPGGARGLHKDDAVRYMELYAPFSREYYALLAGCDGRIYRPAVRAATLGLALLTFRYAQPRSEARGDPSVHDFWRGVVFDDGIEIGDPRKVANRHLFTAVMRYGNTGTATSAPYSTRFIGNCFNAYMERREIKMTKVFDSRSALDVYGVPKDYEQWLI